MSHSSAQWKALILAYPLYGLLADGAAVEQDEVEFFLEEAVPRLQAAFPSVEVAGEEDGGTSSSSAAARRRPAWRLKVPLGLDQLLSFLFGVSSTPPPPASRPVKGKKPEAEVKSFTASERILLRLCAKERCRVDEYHRLLQETQGELRHFRSDFQHSTGMTGGSDSSHHQFQKVNGEMKRFQYDPLPPSTAVIDDRVLQEGTSTPSTANAMSDVNTSNTTSSAVAAPAPLAALPTCDGCFESTGDLYRCANCHGYRHEACGGPHPPSDGSRESPLLFCKACTRAMRLSSESSSDSELRSSTSSDEREELGSVGSTDSSLSGFIVDSDEDDEEEEEEEEELLPPKRKRARALPSHAKKKRSPSPRPAAAKKKDDMRTERRMPLAPSKAKNKQNKQNRKKNKRMRREEGGSDAE